MLNIPGIGSAQPTHNHVAVGDVAPDFELPDQSNRTIHFADLLGKGAVVLFFYPMDFSAGCTTQVCAFRDSYEAFKDVGATVIGVSADSTESHEGFVQRHRLPFILLSDAEGVAQELYGVKKSFGILKERVTYVIDRQGIIRHIFSSQIHIGQHIDDALAVVRFLQGEAERDDQAVKAPSKPDVQQSE